MVKGAWFIVHGVHWLNSDLGQAGTVIYLAHPLFPPPLPQAQSGEVMVIKVMMINGMVIRVMVIKVMGIKAMVIKVMVVITGRDLSERPSVACMNHPFHPSMHDSPDTLS